MTKYARSSNWDDGTPVSMLMTPTVLKDADGEEITNVREMMFITVEENMPIHFAAALMAYEDVFELTVLSAGGERVGRLSALDILHWLSKRDGYLMRATKAKTA